MEQRSMALALPNEADFKRDITAINRFQQIVHQTMVRGLDYGVIPGTGNKPTLLKPGAEKIAKLLGLADQYELIDRQENWETGFFRYLVRCKLTHIASGALVSEGLGECNSMESKYRWRWVFPDDVPDGNDKTKLTKRTGKRKDGKGTYTQYRLENEDIYSQVNTILKMGKKRALVDAALSAGRLSDIFTQDIEDIGEYVEPLTEPAPAIPSTLSKHEPEVIEPQNGSEPPDKPETTPETGEDLGINLDWVNETMTETKFRLPTLVSWLKSKANYAGLDTTGSVEDIIRRMTKPQKEFLSKELQQRREASGL